MTRGELSYCLAAGMAVWLAVLALYCGAWAALPLTLAVVWLSLGGTDGER